jgi:hypothetical protein
MSASFFASFFAYMVTAAYAIYSTPILFTSDPLIKWTVIIVILLVAVYYYYTVAYVEVHPDIHAALIQAPIIEWCIRIVALFVLFMLWVVLELYGWKWFVIVLVVQHLLYLLWDFIVRKHFVDFKKFLSLDLIVLALSVVLFFLSTSNPSFFRVDDLKDPKGLIIALKNSERHPELCNYIKTWDFANETKQLIEQYDDSKPPSEELLNSLVKDLNKTLKDVHLYDEQRFQHVKLTQETLSRIEQNPRGDNLISHNRELLIEAYPGLIEPSSSYSNPIRTHYMLGVITAIYFLVFVFGIFLIRFNPFAFITRPLVR